MIGQFKAFGYKCITVITKNLAVIKLNDRVKIIKVRDRS